MLTNMFSSNTLFITIFVILLILIIFTIYHCVKFSNHDKRMSELNKDHVKILSKHSTSSVSFKN